MKAICRAALVPLALAAMLPNSASALMFNYTRIDGPLGGDTYAIGINNPGQIIVQNWSPTDASGSFSGALYLRAGGGANTAPA